MNRQHENTSKYVLLYSFCLYLLYSRIPPNARRTHSSEWKRKKKVISKQLNWGVLAHDRNPSLCSVTLGSTCTAMVIDKCWHQQCFTSLGNEAKNTLQNHTLLTVDSPKYLNSTIFYSSNFWKQKRLAPKAIPFVRRDSLWRWLNVLLPLWTLQISLFRS